MNINAKEGNRINIQLFILMLLSTAVLIVVSYYKLTTATIIFKCLSSALFLATAWASYKMNPTNTRFFAFMFAGLTFSLGGDVFLVIDKNQGICFILGVASFAFGHIMYSLGYCSKTRLALKDLLVFLCFFVPTFLVVSYAGFEFKGMKLLIIFYAVIISFMVSKSLSMLKFYPDSKKPVALMISGSLLFFVSDYLLLFFLFYPNATPILRQINLSLYYLGQGLLSLSFSYPLKDKINANTRQAQESL